MISGEKKALPFTGKRPRNFASLTYMFVIATGVAVALYLFSASRFSLTLYTVLRSFLLSGEPWVAYTLSLIVSYTPLVAIVLFTLNSLRREVRLSSAVGYSYLLYAVAAKVFNVTIPLAGIASLDLDPVTLAPSVNVLYVVVAIASFTTLILVSSIGKGTVWVTINAYIREGRRLIPLGRKAMRGESQVSVLPGRSLVIIVSGLSSVLHRVFINVVPPTMWDIRSRDRGFSVEVELVPKGIGESSVVVSYEDNVLSSLRVIAGSAKGFANLVIESIISGKRSRIIETEHPVGMPLFYTLERVRDFLPYKSISPHKLSVYLLDDTGTPKEIRMDYSLFEPGRTYHVVIKRRGVPTTATSLVATSISEGEVIKIPLATLTEEYIAKPVSHQTAEDRPRTVVTTPNASHSISWDELRELCGDVW